MGDRGGGGSEGYWSCNPVLKNRKSRGPELRKKIIVTSSNSKKEILDPESVNPGIPSLQTPDPDVPP